MTNENELTDEQVKWLAEFTFPCEPHLKGEYGHWYPIDNMGCKSWDWWRKYAFTDRPDENHSAAQGREAVMDRAVEKGWNEIHFYALSDGTTACFMQHKESVYMTGKAEGPSRFIAFVNALMEAGKR